MWSCCIPQTKVTLRIQNRARIVPTLYFSLAQVDGVDLGPGDSAHFLFGATRYDLNSGNWRMKCDVPGLQLILPGEDQFLSLPFDTGTCAEITVSAWRAGEYDGDPLNVEFDKRVEEWRKAAEAGPLPTECKKTDFTKAGRPVVFPDSKGLEIGISAERDHFTKGEAVGLHFWDIDRTDKPISYSSCPPRLNSMSLIFMGTACSLVPRRKCPRIRNREYRVSTFVRRP